MSAFCWKSIQVRGTVTTDLGSHEIVSSRGNKSRAAMFILAVTEVLEDWPESHRKRKTVRGGAGGWAAGVREGVRFNVCIVAQRYTVA